MVFPPMSDIKHDFKMVSQPRPLMLERVQWSHMQENCTHTEGEPGARLV